MPKTREVAELMASKPVMAFRLNKQRFRQVTQEAFDEAFRNGGKIQAEAYASGEPQETMRRFFAERAARRKARGRPRPRAPDATYRYRRRRAFSQANRRHVRTIRRRPVSFGRPHQTFWLWMRGDAGCCATVRSRCLLFAIAGARHLTDQRSKSRRKSRLHLVIPRRTDHPEAALAATIEASGATLCRSAARHHRHAKATARDDGQRRRGTRRPPRPTAVMHVHDGPPKGRPRLAPDLCDCQARQSGCLAVRAGDVMFMWGLHRRRRCAATDPRQTAMVEHFHQPVPAGRGHIHFSESADPPEAAPSPDRTHGVRIACEAVARNLDPVRTAVRRQMLRHDRVFEHHDYMMRRGRLRRPSRALVRRIALVGIVAAGRRRSAATSCAPAAWRDHARISSNPGTAPCAAAHSTPATSAPSMQATCISTAATDNVRVRGENVSRSRSNRSSRRIRRRIAP